MTSPNIATSAVDKVDAPTVSKRIRDRTELAKKSLLKEIDSYDEVSSLETNIATFELGSQPK